MPYKLTSVCDFCGFEVEIPTGLFSDMMAVNAGFSKKILECLLADAPLDLPVRVACTNCARRQTKGIVPIGSGSAAQTDDYEKVKPS